jgi:hypothetical protein
MANEIDLEKLIARRLRALPELEAPPTLAPRILAAIRARAALPWWRQSLWYWPAMAKAAFVALAIGLVGGLYHGGWLLSGSVSQWPQPTFESLGRIGELAEYLRPLSDALVNLCPRFGQPHWTYVVALAGAMYLMCVGLGTVCYRVAMKRA